MNEYYKNLFLLIVGCALGYICTFSFSINTELGYVISALEFFAILVISKIMCD